MQVGGNRDASQYFTNAGVTSSDLSTKYSSAAATRYRAKIEKDAVKLHKKLGTRLFDDGEDATAEEENVNFFEDDAVTAANKSLAAQPVKVSVPVASSTGTLSASLAGPKSEKSEDGSGSPTVVKKKLVVKKKVGIGAKKPSGLGAKKTGGLGAVKKTGQCPRFPNGMRRRWQ